eukprot:4339804-Karenia_brevis.AAC.1
MMNNSGNTTIAAILQLCRSEVEYGSKAHKQFMSRDCFPMLAKLAVQLSSLPHVLQHTACLSLSWLHGIFIHVLDGIVRHDVDNCLEKLCSLLLSHGGFRQDC